MVTLVSSFFRNQCWVGFIFDVSCVYESGSRIQIFGKIQPEISSRCLVSTGKSRVLQVTGQGLGFLPLPYDRGEPAVS